MILPCRGDKNLQLESICLITDSLVHLPPRNLADPLWSMSSPESLQCQTNREATSVNSRYPVEDLVGDPSATQKPNSSALMELRALGVECPNRCRCLPSRSKKSPKSRGRRNQILPVLVGLRTPTVSPPICTATQRWQPYGPLAFLRVLPNPQRLRQRHRFWWTHGVQDISSKRYVYTIPGPIISSPHDIR